MASPVRTLKIAEFTGATGITASFPPPIGKVLVIQFITLYYGIGDGSGNVRMRSLDGLVPTVWFQQMDDPAGGYGAFTGKWVSDSDTSIGWDFVVDQGPFGTGSPADISVHGYQLQLP